jgi:M6 family metalloprotease-like protein
MESLESRLPRRMFGCLLAAALFGAMPASAISPVGLQKVLVIPIDLGSTMADLCPYKTPCPVTSQDAATYQPPRYNTQSWENLLNNYGTRYWQLASYGQTQVQFTVLASPFGTNGWWIPPHAAADYYNNGDVFIDSKTFAFVEDAARGAITLSCLFLNCSFGQYDRLIVLSNKKARGGTTYAAGPMTVPTAFGKYTFTATMANESVNDSDALSVMMHEFGHQLGIPTHYGDCGPSYIPAVQTAVECVGVWDIMGFDWIWSQPTGYSRFSRGWIDPKSTISYDLLSGIPFSTLTFMRPVEQAPNGVPNLVRLSISGLNAPQFHGYYAECRMRINGDEGLYPASPGLFQKGLLITRVHEYSYPPMHVVRKVFPPGDTTLAALQPGESFSDPQLGLFIRLNGYAGDDAEPFCDVEVDYLSPPFQGPILLWQNRVVGGPVTGFGSFDIGMNHPLPPGDLAAGPAADQPLKVEPVWPHHNNVLFARAHTAGTLAAENVKLNVSITQPALLTSNCGSFTDPKAQEVLLRRVDPLTGGSSTLDFRPHPSDSLGVQMYAPADPAAGRDASNTVATRIAFDFFDAKSGAQQTRFTLSANRGCGEETTFHISPAVVPPGWEVSVRPEIVALAPGTRTDVVVTVAPPAGALPGENGEIQIDVSEVEDTSRPTLPDRPLDPLLLKHIDPVGSLQISGRVVGDPALVNLSCTGSGGRGGPVSISGRIVPPVSGATVLLEYRSLGATQTRFVATDAAGVFQDSFASGRGHVQAFWPGDATHAPAESKVCPF